MMMMNDDLDNDLLQYYNDKTIYMSVYKKLTIYVYKYICMYGLDWINNNNKPLLIVVRAMRLLIIIKSAHIFTMCVFIYYAAARFIFV